MSDSNTNNSVYDNLPEPHDKQLARLDRNSDAAFRKQFEDVAFKPAPVIGDEAEVTPTSLIDQLVPPVSDAEFLRDLRRDVELRDMQLGVPAVEHIVDVVDVDEAQPAGIVEQAEITLAYENSQDPTDGYTSPADDHIAKISGLAQQASSLTELPGQDVA